MRSAANIQLLLIIGLICPLIALNIWILYQAVKYFEHLFTILTVAGILAFLLNYFVRFLERLRLQRTQAVIIVVLLTLALLGILGVTLVPILLNQLEQLLSNIPDWFKSSNYHLEQLDILAKNRGLPLDLRGFSYRISVQIESQVQTFASQVLGVALGTVSGLIDFIFILVLSFYMLLYGDRLWESILNLLPPQFGKQIGGSLQRNFENFFLSQLLLGLFMVITLTPLFLVLQVPFAFLFALLIGTGQLVPIIGATLGIGLVAVLVMLKDFGLGLQVAIAATIMQQIKDNILAPKLMGDFTGLNPVWIFISLLFGGQVAGFLGVIVAIPIAATLKDTIDIILIESQPPAS